MDLYEAQLKQKIFFWRDKMDYEQYDAAFDQKIEKAKSLMFSLKTGKISIDGNEFNHEGVSIERFLSSLSRNERFSLFKAVHIGSSGISLFFSSVKEKIDTSVLKQAEKEQVIYILENGRDPVISFFQESKISNQMDIFWDIDTGKNASVVLSAPDCTLTHEEILQISIEKGFYIMKGEKDTHLSLIKDE